YTGAVGAEVVAACGSRARARARMLERCVLLRPRSGQIWIFLGGGVASGRGSDEGRGLAADQSRWSRIAVITPITPAAMIATGTETERVSRIGSAASATDRPTAATDQKRCVAHSASVGGGLRMKYACRMIAAPIKPIVTPSTGGGGAGTRVPTSARTTSQA